MAREQSVEVAEGLHHSVGQIKRSSGLTEEVYKRIRADIMSMRIPPDTRIFVDYLSRELGVSQTPVREALSMLEAIGLVTKRHFIGYCTAPKFNREQYRKLFEIRLLLEPHAARMAAERVDPSCLAELGKLVDRMEPEGVVGSSTTSYEAFADRDSEFHALIASAGENNLIAEALDRLHTHLHIFRIGVQSDYATEAKVEHVKIMHALERHDPDAAEKAMRAHIENAFQRLIPFMKP
jgi:DNA-binding GntR family transcriptional regulator